MNGNTIRCNVDPKGRFLEGAIGAAGMYPGIKVMLKPGATPIGGRPVYIPYSPGSNDNPSEMLILLDDPYQGFTPGQVYINGTRCFVYSPLSGDEMNVLVTGEAGTGSANAFFVGDGLVPITGTGMYTKDNNPAHFVDFKVMEHIDTVVDTPTLVWAMKT